MRFRTDSPADLRRYSAVLALLLIATSSPADTGQTAISEGAEVIVPEQVPKDEDLEMAGAIIGGYMDRQAAEIERDIEGAKVERIGEGIKITFDSGILQTEARLRIQLVALDHQGEMTAASFSMNIKHLERTGPKWP